MITTQKQLRAAFWQAHPQFKRGVKRIGTKDGRAIYAAKTQNDYPADVRMAWCDFVESTRRAGDITENLAERATL